MHVVAVVCLEVVSLKRQPLSSEAVVFGDQLLGDRGIIDSVTNAVGDVVRHLAVGLFVEEDCGEVRSGDGEARLRIKLVPGLDSLFLRQVPEAAAVWDMFEPAGRC